MGSIFQLHVSLALYMNMLIISLVDVVRVPCFKSATTKESSAHYSRLSFLCRLFLFTASSISSAPFCTAALLPFFAFFDGAVDEDASALMLQLV